MRWPLAFQGCATGRQSAGSPACRDDDGPGPGRESEPQRRSRHPGRARRRRKWQRASFACILLFTREGPRVGARTGHLLFPEDPRESRGCAGQRNHVGNTPAGQHPSGWPRRERPRRGPGNGGLVREHPAKVQNHLAQVTRSDQPLLLGAATARPEDVVRQAAKFGDVSSSDTALVLRDPHRAQPLPHVLLGQEEGRMERCRGRMTGLIDEATHPASMPSATAPARLATGRTGQGAAWSPDCRPGAASPPVGRAAP